MLTEALKEATLRETKQRKIPNQVRGQNKKMTMTNESAVESKRSEPKKMTYLEALKKTKTKDNDHEQTTIKTKIRKLG